MPELRFLLQNPTEGDPNMVTARGDLHDSAKFVLDMCSIPLSEISVSAWVQILDDVRKRLPTRYLRGFQSLREHFAALEKGITSASIPRVVSMTHLVGALEEWNFKVESQFFYCADIVDTLPYTWWADKNTKRKTAPKSGTSKSLFLSRDGGFYLLTVRWVGIEGRKLEDLYYKATYVGLRPLGDLEGELLGAREAGKTHLELDVLHSLSNCVDRTLREIAGQEERLRECAKLLHGCLSRIGS